MSALPPGSPPAPALLPEWQNADFVRQALMPDVGITEALVQASVQNRLDDFAALLQAVLASPALARHHARWQQAARDLAARTAAERFDIGSSPLFRHWLHSSGRALIAGAPAPAVAPLLAAVNNYVTGLVDGAPAVVLVARHACIETWDCATSVRLPPGSADGSWLCQRRGDTVLLCPADTAGPFLSLPLQPPLAMLPASGIAVRNDLPALRITLDESRAPEREGTVQDDAVDLRASAYPACDCASIVDAAHTVLTRWPDAYDEWRCMMRVTVPRLPPPGWRMNGFTISSMQGAAWIHPSDPVSALESLVHEHSHVKLRYVEESVPLLQPGQSDARFAVGWRSDPRPLVGIFEGVYVHAHCAMALTRCLADDALPTSQRTQLARRVGELRSQAQQGLKLLRSYARFTPAGQGYLQWAQAVCV